MINIEDKLVVIVKTVGAIEVKLECMERQLIAMERRQNLKQLENKHDVYLAAVILGAAVFLALRMVPI
jgi:hypothetical protein